MSDEDVQGFLRAFRDAVDLAHRTVGDGGEGERFAEAVGEHLGGPADQFAVVTEEVVNHRYADWDTALALLAAQDPEARELGIGAVTCGITRPPPTSSPSRTDASRSGRWTSTRCLSVPTNTAGRSASG